MWIVCTRCGSRHEDVPGDLKQYRCPVCGDSTLVRIRTEEEGSKEALAGMVAGAAVGAAVGELPGALIGGAIGFVLGFFRTPTLEQVKR